MTGMREVEGFIKVINSSGGSLLDGFDDYAAGRHGVGLGGGGIGMPGADAFVEREINEGVFHFLQGGDFGA